MSARSLHSVINSIGPHAAAIERLWWVMFWTVTVVFVVVMALFGIAVWRGRKRELPVPHQAEKLSRAVSAGVALTVVVLFGLLVGSMWTSNAVASVAGVPAAVTIQVVGHQWWWEIEYDDEVASRRITLANEMHVPTGRQIVLKVTSRDVIHSFWVPNVQGKRDLIPGYVTAIWFQADRPGVYRGQCAEYCGRQHAHMAFTLVAESPEAFERWRDGERQPAREPQEEAARRGRDIFMTNRCVGCHTIRGTSAGAQVAPDLTHIGARGALGAGILPNTREHLAQWIANPQAFKPGNQMPPNPLSSDDLQSLAAYLETLK